MTICGSIPNVVFRYVSLPSSDEIHSISTMSLLIVQKRRIFGLFPPDRYSLANSPCSPVK